MRKAQEELAKQKEVIMAQDKELKVNSVFLSLFFFLLIVVTFLKIILFIWNFQGKSTEANKIREQNNEIQLKIKELEHNINKHRKDSQDAADKVHTTLNVSHTVPCCRDTCS